MNESGERHESGIIVLRCGVGCVYAPDYPLSGSVPTTLPCVLGVTHPTRSAVALISDLANGRTLGPGGPGVEALRYGDVLSVLHSRQGLDGRGDGGQVDSTQATHVAQGHTGKVTSGL